MIGCVPASLEGQLDTSLSALIGLPFCGDMSGNSATDRTTLVALYNATDGPNWTNNENWLSDAPTGERHGV